MNLNSHKDFMNFIQRADSEIRLNPAKNALRIACCNIEIALRTRKGSAKAEISVIEFFEDDVPLQVYCSSGIGPKEVTAATLAGAAKSVYDFCKKAGLNPAVYWKHASDQNHILRITAQLPVGKVVKKRKFPKNPVRPRPHAKLGSR